ncbi:hypothetical protein MR942_01155, partial [bacterium]|nr:hypothetical protein [bacterium]
MDRGRKQSFFAALMENILFLLVIFQQKLYNKDTMIRERSVSGLAEDFVIEMLNITKEFPG